MRFCFVAQPYRKKYDQLYKNVFKKAIEKADFEPYRADENPAVTQIWPEIVVKIAESRIVLAEITEDNPNVWMEVGCAMALGKKIGFISRQKRKIPVDIAGEFILFYHDFSGTSLKMLRDEITEHLQAVFETVKRAAILGWRPIAAGGGIGKDEMLALALLSDHQDDYPRGMTAQGLLEELNDIGSVQVDSVGKILASLKKRKLVSSRTEVWKKERYVNHFLTRAGIGWVLDRVPDWGQKAHLGEP